MHPLRLFVAVVLLALAGTVGAQTAPGKLKGRVGYTLPDWFKPSFLDLRVDVEDARRANRHVLLFVRLDTDSSAPVIDLDGKSVTPGQWAKTIDPSHRPAPVLYDEGREIIRVDAPLYHFHLRERLRYVSGAYYKRYASRAAYNAARRSELRKQGIDIDYAE